MRIVAVDLFPVNKPEYVERLDNPENLPVLLGESDYVVVTVPFTPQTENIFGEREFAQMKPGAYLVGVSRGGIINERALASALRDGHLNGAALDVCEREPLPADSDLWDLPNLLLTPHTAGGSQYELERLYSIFSANLARYLDGKFPLINQIDKQRGF